MGWAKNKKWWVTGLLVLLCAAGALTWLLGFRGPETIQDQKYLVGAYYYQWFPHNFTRGYLREKLSPPQPPVLGRYSSRDPEVVEQHIAWASSHGIDFLALDWWPGVDKVNSVISESFLKAKNIGDIKFCLFYESYGAGFRAEYGSTIFSDQMVENFVADVLKMAGLFFDHPSYLRVAGRPVVFFYVSRTFYGKYDEALSRIRAELNKKGVDPFFIGDEIFWNVTATIPNRAGKTGVEVVDIPVFSKEPQKERIRLFDAVTSYNMYESEYPSHAGYGAKSRHIPEVEAKYREYKRPAGARWPWCPMSCPATTTGGTGPTTPTTPSPASGTRAGPRAPFWSVPLSGWGFPLPTPG